jgi:hypothetical protein
MSSGPGEVFTVDLVIPLSGVTDKCFNWFGELRISDCSREVALAVTGDYLTPFAVSNNRVCVNINSITGSGNLLITGSIVDLTSKVVTPSATELVYVDSTGRYKTENEWWDCEKIEVLSGITSISYDVEVVGYIGAGNVDFAVMGYRADIFSHGTNPSVGIEITKVSDDGGKRCSIVKLESIGINSGSSGDQIVDSLRSGADDRSYDPSYAISVWGSKETAVLEQQDFYSYFTGGENIVRSSTSQEGLVLFVRGEDGTGEGNISSVSLVNMFIILQRI